MSLSTTAAARQNEIKASIAVVAMRTFGARRVGVSDVERSARSLISASKPLEDAEKENGHRAQSGPWPSGVDRALPETPTGLADGLGLGSVLWRRSPMRPCGVGPPRSANHAELRLDRA